MTEHSPPSRVGTRFGPYLLKRLLGRGGMGEVYEAVDTVKGRTVAVKMLPDALTHDPVFRERLQREARSAGRLQEPHVVPIHDYGEIDGQLYVDMRLIDGVDLRTVLRRDGPMPPDRAVSIVSQIASALDAAHAAGVLHRDVKPENILLTSDDFAYLVDFGIASAATDHTLTEQGTTIGTYAYMAPERFSNREVTHRADIYALACVLHQCLTGAQPFPAASVSVLITAHLMEPPPRPSALRPDVPAALDDVVARGMAKNAADRYASAGELADAAASAIGGAGLHATVPAAAFRAPKPATRRWIVGAAALAVLLTAATVAVWSAVRPNGAAETAGSAGMTQTVTRTVTSAPRAPAPLGDAHTPAERRLLGLMPTDLGRCQPVAPVEDAVATVDCGPGSGPDGPDVARYSLFVDIDDLDAAFSRTLDDDAPADCPGPTDSPGTWDYPDSTPDSPEGSFACGSYGDTPELVWTKDADLVLGLVQGPDLDQLYDWWLTSS